MPPNDSLPLNNLIQVHLFTLVEHAVEAGVMRGYRQAFRAAVAPHSTPQLIDIIARHVMLELHEVIDFERSAWRTSALQGSPTGFGDPDT